MELRGSDVVVAVMMIVFALLGLTLAAHSRDDEMYVFGLAMAGMGCAFVFNLIRRYYDRLDAAHAKATGHE